MTAATALCPLLAAGAFLGLAVVDRRALLPVLGTAAAVVALAAYVALLFTL